MTMLIQAPGASEAEIQRRLAAAQASLVEAGVTSKKNFAEADRRLFCRPTQSS
ncbi:hypothetical protein RCH10_004524 [Variovorax sp. GrIS 2.14]|uniref:hypothetical protein n=1 Tax=Variovorax sp. GrIS 2.14 TaxID=3071709 RepID=UPI0038F7D19A